MNNKYLVVLEVANTDRGCMPLDGKVVVQLTAESNMNAISKAKRNIYNEYGGNNDVISCFKVEADTLMR